MRRLALLLALLLAACGREEAPPTVPAAVSFRDRGVPIGSTVRGGLSDLGGEWVIAESFPGLPFASPGTRLRVEPGAEGRALLRFEGAGGPREVSVRTAAPGRFRAEAGHEFWLLWVDDDFRTAVIGTPDGSFGWVMDRPGQASPDRRAAAREVLDWSGYDVARLVAGSGT